MATARTPTPTAPTAPTAQPGKTEMTAEQIAQMKEASKNLDAGLFLPKEGKVEKPDTSTESYCMI